MNDVASAVEAPAARITATRPAGRREASHGDGALTSAAKDDFGQALAEVGTDDGGAARAVVPGERLARNAGGGEPRAAAGADGGHFLLRQRTFVLPGSLPADSVVAQDGEAPEDAVGEGDAPAGDQAQTDVTTVAPDAAKGAQLEAMNVALTVADLGAFIGVGRQAPPAPPPADASGQRSALAPATAGGDAAASAMALLRVDGAVKPAVGGDTAADHDSDDGVPAVNRGADTELRLIGRETHLGGIDARHGAPGGGGEPDHGNGASEKNGPRHATSAVAEPQAASEGQKPAQSGTVEVGALKTQEGPLTVNGPAPAADTNGAATRPGQQVGSEVLRWLASSREDAALRRATPSHVLQIELVPADLGRVQVRIALKDNQLLVDLNVESGKAAGMIEQDKHKLIGELTSAGYAVDRLTVKNDVVAPTLPSNAGSQSASADGSNGAAQGFGGGAQSEARGRGRNSGTRSQAATADSDSGADTAAAVSRRGAKTQQLYL
jgi:flagellar hook-length control protein FliK